MDLCIRHNGLLDHPVIPDRGAWALGERSTIRHEGHVVDSDRERAPLLDDP